VAHGLHDQVRWQPDDLAIRLYLSSVIGEDAQRSLGREGDPDVLQSVERRRLDGPNLIGAQYFQMESGPDWLYVDHSLFQATL
jgi:hypothetical protein